MQMDKTRVVILTERLRIEGEIGLLPGVRLTDYMTEAKMFIAVSNVTVTDFDGNKRLRGTLLNVHRDKINVIMPVAASDERPEPGEDL
jgi:hypothetical protein